MMHGFRKIFRSIRFGLAGLSHAYRSDESFRLEIHWGMPIYLTLGYLLSPLTHIEWILFFFSYLLILIVELVNTSIEKLLDRLHPESHELIEKSKDIASAAVFLSFLFAGVVMVFLSFSEFFS